MVICYHPYGKHSGSVGSILVNRAAGGLGLGRGTPGGAAVRVHIHSVRCTESHGRNVIYEYEYRAQQRCAERAARAV